MLWNINKTHGVIELIVYSLILIFAVIDHFLTYWELSLGIAEEANPILHGIMAMPIIISFPLRYMWISLMLFLLWKISRIRQELVKKALKFVALIYGMVIIYHCIIIFLSHLIPNPF